MVSSKETSVDGYLASLPPDRRDALAAVRSVILARLPRGYEEAMQYGMIGYCVPLSRYSETYNEQPLTVAVLASQKRHMALYLQSVYGDPELARWFQAHYRASGKKLDMGKSCVRFRRLEDLPLDVIGDTIARVPVEDLIAAYERARAATAKALPARTVRDAAATEALAKTAPATNAAPAKKATAANAPGKEAPATKTAPATEATAAKKTAPAKKKN